MKRLAKKFVSFALATVASASLLAGCGGGSSRAGAVPPAAAPTATPLAAAYTGPLADATFKITIPAPPKTGSAARRPTYVSSSTTKIVFTLNSATISGMNGATLATFNTTNLGAKPVTLGSAQCPGAGPWTCTLPLRLPPGADNLTISAQDASSNILSQQKQDLTVVAAAANSFSVTLDANANVMTVTTSSGFCAGTFAVTNSGSVATVGTTSVTFNTAYTDLAGKTIIGPGLPLLTVNGHTDDSAGAGYTDSTTHLNVKVTQSTQSFTLTQTAGTGSAAVAVSAVSPSTGAPSTPADGLNFNKQLSFTFQSGTAPPANFLAVAERLANGNNATTGGQIALYTLTLGASDSFNAASPSLLPSATNGIATTRHDVDFPNDLLFDPNGDLLIANGGGNDGSGDTGNFSCVPAGSITTGANNATVLTNSNTSADLNNPHYIALLGDSAVALSNATAAAAKTNGFPLSGTYGYSATRSIGNTGSYANIGTNQIVALPATGTNPSGSYAVAITNGTTQAGNHVVIKRPDGSSSELPSDASDIDSNIGYDLANDQLVLVNNNSTSSTITFWDMPGMTKAKTITVDGDSGGGLSGNAQAVPSQAGSVVAVSPTGYVAVSVFLVGNEINIYNNNKTSRALVSAPIPFDATQTNGGGFGTDYCYGGSGSNARVLSMRWLPTGGGTYNKLLVGVESTSGSAPSIATNAPNGLYIFDISQAASATPVAPSTCSGATFTYPWLASNPSGQVQPYAKQTGYINLNGPRPLAAGFKP